MKETCMNCKSYWSEVCNPDNREEHEHNFCILHGCFLNPWHKNGWLIDDDVQDVVYDDLETGIASCYLFEPKEAPSFNDEWFDEHKAHNDKIEAELIQKAKQEGWYWDEKKEG